MKPLTKRGTSAVLLLVLLAGNFSLLSSSIFADPVSQTGSHFFHPKKIIAYVTEDLETDEAYLLINGNKVWAGDLTAYTLTGWQGRKTYVAGSAELSLGDIPIDKNVKIQIFDEDWPDADDFLGESTVEIAKQPGDYVASFHEDGALYEVEYSIISYPDPSIGDINGPFSLVAQHSGKCLDLLNASSDNGAVVGQWDCLGPQQTNQMWRLQPDGDGYNIISVGTGKCLDLAAEEWNNNGGKVQQWDCIGNGWTNQLWHIQQIGSAYQIISPNGKCLDVSGVSVDNGAVVWQWDCGGAQQTNQLWALVR